MLSLRSSLPVPFVIIETLIVLSPLAKGVFTSPRCANIFRLILISNGSLMGLMGRYIF